MICARKYCAKYSFLDRYKSLYALNLFDCAVTLWLVYMFGTEIEGNLFGLVMLQSPLLTILFKVVVIGMAILILYQYRYRPIVTIITQTLFLLYILLTLYHLYIVYCIIKIYAEAGLMNIGEIGFNQSTR